HGLGEAFSETIRPADLHRLIVEGATRVLDAQGGALYLVDRSGTKLAPTFISKGCPPLVDVPSHILQQARLRLPRSKAFCACTRSVPAKDFSAAPGKHSRPSLLMNSRNRRSWQNFGTVRSERAR